MLVHAASVRCVWTLRPPDPKAKIDTLQRLYSFPELFMWKPNEDAGSHGRGLTATTKAFEWLQSNTRKTWTFVFERCDCRFFFGGGIVREKGGMCGGQYYLPQSLSTIFVFWTDWILGPLANCLGWLESKSQESSCLCFQSTEHLDDRCGLGIQTQFLMLAFYQAEPSFPCLLTFLSCYFWCCWGMNPGLCMW